MYSAVNRAQALRLNRQGGNGESPPHATGQHQRNLLSRPPYWPGLTWGPPAGSQGYVAVLFGTSCHGLPPEGAQQL